jgi:hypothetical protein
MVLAACACGLWPDLLHRYTTRLMPAWRCKGVRWRNGVWSVRAGKSGKRKREQAQGILEARQVLKLRPHTHLYNHLCTFVAWEERGVECAVGGAHIVRVEKRIHLCMADIWKLCVERIVRLLVPGQLQGGGPAVRPCRLFRWVRRPRRPKVGGAQWGSHPLTSSSEQPTGNPLYPMETITPFGLTMQQPTCEKEWSCVGGVS